ncbi:MAG TPA: formate dehydrogenase accessory sulfurtransferase FdhD [Actinomycetota bacterium]|nr:formate dehydrogenase accessory sulfurtransferase FdhD [Actinomycetota bacterium]
MSERPAASRPTVVRRVARDGKSRPRSETLATEEPLEIRLHAAGEERELTVTMRTPGNDFELATGFLYGESILTGKDDLIAVRYCQPQAEQQYNVVTVDLRGPVPETARLDRNFFTSSACGVCGKATLDQIEVTGVPDPGPGPRVSPETLLALPERLRRGQKVFSKTGGVHAAGLFDAEGDLECVREDVGRHNAMDKLVGWSFLQGRLPLSDRIVLVSGRASFELVQKALRAGAGMLCAVSAPSTLAVDLAARFGMTLVGFLRDESFNVYTGEERVLL